MSGFLKKNIVPIVFIVICLTGYYYSKLPLMFFINDLISRLARNSYLVISLIIPVLAGMGLNFGIVLGAMAGQLGAIFTVFFNIGGLPGFVAAAALSLPFALLFGWMTGELFNRTKGKEMITGMILGFFANGVYLLVLLVLVGPVIPVSPDNAHLLLPSGVGLVNTIDLTLWQYTIDKWYVLSFNIPPVSMVTTVVVIVLSALAVFLARFGRKRLERGAFDAGAGRSTEKARRALAVASTVFSTVLCLFLLQLFRLAINQNIRIRVNLPVASLALTALLCIGIWQLFRTRLGQNIRAVGQSMHIAEVAGISVNRIRVIAIIFSTVLAAWGQLFFLQNLGNLQTYGSHVQVGTFAVAALLVGGASVSRATVGQALIGIILFHTLFIVSPMAGKNLMGSAQIGEFFRVFVAYGVIGVALALHAWQRKKS